MNSDLDDLYQETLMDHAKNKKYRYKPAVPCSCVSAHNPLCGDQIEFFLVKDVNGCVSEACFDGKGCAISQAATSIAADSIVGLSTDNAKNQLEKALAFVLGRGGVEGLAGDWEALGGVVKFPMRVKCASMGIRAALGSLAINAGESHEL